MKPLFVDTSYYIALLNAGDRHHSQAVQWGRNLRRTVLITEFIFLELGNALSYVKDRRLLVSLLPHLQSDANTVIIPASHDLLQRGYLVFSRRLDKDWSLTDCTSFVVMKEHGITDALTADHHFEQAGFTALLK